MSFQINRSLKQGVNESLLSIVAPMGRRPSVTINAPKPDEIRALAEVALAPGSPLTPKSPSLFPKSPSLSPFEIEIFAPLRFSIASLKVLEGSDSMSVEDKLEKIEQLEVRAKSMESSVTRFLGLKKSPSPQHDPDSDEKSSPELSQQTKPTIPVHVIVHELRTPLHNIAGRLGLWRSYLVDPVTNKALIQESIKALHDAYKHVAKIAKQLENTNIPLELEKHPFSVAEFIKYVGHQTSQCDSRVKVEFLESYDGKLVLDGDSLKLAEVLINLIGNAIKYSPKPGTVRVVVKQKEIGANRTALHFEVLDDGPGMSAEVIGSLFRLYSTAGKATDTTMESTGIGLYISQTYAELMGGKIGVQSELGKGSCFFFGLEFDIPAKTTEPLPSSPFPQLTTPKKKEAVKFNQRSVRILAAEDCKITRKMYERFFQAGAKVGCEPTYTLVPNGESAFREFASPETENFYDIILLDMQMEDADSLTGWDFAKKIYAFAVKYQRRIPPIIMITGDPATANEDKIDQANAEGLQTFTKQVVFLSKPTERDKLVSTINTLVERSRSQVA